MSEEALYAAILAAPRDDEPRLVYADLLLERGDPRGELIVVQCERARCERERTRRTAKYRSAVARERALVAKHGIQWLAPFKRSATLRRGFIESVELTPPVLRSSWDELARLPLERLLLKPAPGSTLSATRGDLAWLASRASTIETVSLASTSGVRVDLDWSRAREALLGIVETDRTLALDPNLALPSAPLHEVTQRVELTPATTARVGDLALRAGRSLTSLSVLGLGNEDARLLRDSPALRGLLDLSVDGEAASILLEDHPRAPPRLPLLQKLAVRGRSLGTDLVRALATMKSLPGLLSLDLTIGLEDSLTDLLARRAAKLEELTLRGPTHDAELQTLVSTPLPRQLRHLSLVGSEGSYGPPSIRPLLGAELSRLETLRLSKFLIGDSNAEAMSNTPSLTSLVELSLTSCQLTDVRVRALARSPHLGAIVWLDLQNNNISASTVRDMASRWPDAEILV